MKLFRAFLIAIVCLLMVNQHHVSAEQKHPNIIVILGDDMGVDSVAAFNDKLGLKTPHLDRLASEGMSFMDAHSTSAVCTPTRYGLLTGRYNWRSRLKRGIVGRWERPLIEDERLTLPEMLKEKGYQTASIGKWHLGWNWPKKGGGFTSKVQEIDFKQPIKGGPNDHGFDYAFGDDVPNWPPYVWRENEMLLGDLTANMKAGKMVGVSAGPSIEDWDFRAVLREYGIRCSKYIRERAEEEQPFFLYFPMPSPHTPIAPHADFQGKTGISEYADFLVQTDAVVGQLLTALDETDQTKETLVIFTCDNGTSPKANFAELRSKGVELQNHWRGNKADAYEGGHRVPFIVRWPGQIRPGIRSDEIMTLADIMTTCADVVDYKLPPNVAEDSVSLLPILREDIRSAPLHESVVHHSISGHFAIRKGDWKLLLCKGSGGWSAPREAEAAKKKMPAVQLFNLKDDPKESHNLQAQYPGKVEELTADLRGIVERGRSTPGPEQPNHGDADWWRGLPWGK